MSFFIHINSSFFFPFDECKGDKVLVLCCSGVGVYGLVFGVLVFIMFFFYFCLFVDVVVVTYWCILFMIL